MTEIEKQSTEVTRHLNELYWMRKMQGLLDDAYDWLSMEITQLEHGLFWGGELG